MSLATRILLLTVLSVSGIVVLAPLAARSAATLPAELDVADRLLPAGGLSPEVMVNRGSLSARLSTGDVPPETPERLGDALPTPGSAPMEATLRSVAPPPPNSPPAAPAPPPASVTYSGHSVWDDLAQCESGGNWSINTGNGYYGGLQFSYGTWHDYGGGEFAEYPHQATREEQIVVAERLRDARGYAPWPACREKLGLP